MPRIAPQSRESDFAPLRGESLVGEASTPPPFVPLAPGGLLADLPTPPPGSPTGWPWDVQTPPLEEPRADLPEIFIAMPSYRQGQYIEAALRSILLQNYPRLRLVVMDAASPDDTAQVLRRYRPWLSFVRSAPDRGQSHALNLAFSLAGKSGLLGWLNSDDLLLPGALFAVAKVRISKKPDFIYGDALSLDQGTGRITLDRAGLAHPLFRRYPGSIYSHAAFWSASLRLPFREDLHCALDYEMWIRLLPATRRRHHIPRPLGVIRVHPAAKSHDPAIADRWLEDSRVNGSAHPSLYGPDPVLSRIHRVATRLARALRHRSSLCGAREACATARWICPDIK